MVDAMVEEPNDAPATQPQDGDPATDAIWSALQQVTDPEIPVLNVVEMGMIADVRIQEGEVHVDLTPTFVGCPAIDMIRNDVRDAVAALGHRQVTVNVVFDPPWTTERITAEGRRKIKEFGIAPPEQGCGCGPSSLPKLERIACPHCDSKNTELESIFGPTLCRSIHYCHKCLQSFEHFKAV